MELSAPDLILQNGYDTMDESDESMLIVDDEFADIESEPVVEKSSDHTTSSIPAADENPSEFKIPINLGYIGLGIGLLAIFLFLFASNLTGEWKCSTKTYEWADGSSEEYTCGSDYTIFDAPSTKIRCFSCFILVPLGILLSLAGREQNQGVDATKLNYIAEGAATGYVSVVISESDDKTSASSIVSSAGLGLNISLLILGILAVIGFIALLFFLVLT